ncbi:energy transducer TonB [Pseudoalteromonas sp. SCSIO 43088]|nr:energy transducer TonB [Pseudoalteromonas sp. SCSIO 43088]
MHYGLETDRSLYFSKYTENNTNEKIDEPKPIVRIEPKYPVQAARDGKEGWVRLTFTINEVGGVEDVNVIEAEPSRVFDREAKRALRKWKFRSKIQDGKPVKQKNMEVKLDFKLSS